MKKNLIVIDTFFFEIQIYGNCLSYEFLPHPHTSTPPTCVGIFYLPLLNCTPKTACTAASAIHSRIPPNLPSASILFYWTLGKSSTVKNSHMLPLGQKCVLRIVT